MSRSEKEHREAERAARRAKRLADRADTRAQRKGDLAREAQERAERLAERANRKRGPRERALEESFEDFVDDVTDKWSKKAEDWMDEQSGKLFGAETDDLNGGSSAAAEARAARKDAAAARKAAEEAAAYARQSAQGGRGAPRYEEDLKTSRNYRSDKESRRARRKRRTGAFSSAKRGFSFSKKSSRRKGGTLYRDSENGKFMGICAGLADYSNMDTWVVRALAIAGVLFMPSIIVPSYFVLYFVLDDKPLYRKVTDKFEEVIEPYVPSEDTRTMSSKRKSKKKHNSPEKTVENMRQVKKQFAKIESRLRQMETHVTSSQFELHREFNKMTRDEPKGAV